MTNYKKKKLMIGNDGNDCDEKKNKIMNNDKEKDEKYDGTSKEKLQPRF